MAVHELFAYLCVRDAAAAIAFYTRAFGARETFRLTDPKGRVGHAELELGNQTLMLTDEFPEYAFQAPTPGSHAPAFLHLHVDDADEVMRVAVAAGAEIVRPAADQFFGERTGRLRDPFGHEWIVGHAIEGELSPEEMQRRYIALSEG